MALNYSKKKNLIKSPDEYTRYYGDFRGVDFSSDHTEVHEQRLAYAINMYKDYRTGEGNAIETVPGYRRRFQAPRVINASGAADFEAIYGIHEFPYTKGRSDILVHAGKHLYLWDNYPESVNVLLQHNVTVPAEGDLKITIDFTCEKVVSIIVGGSEFISGFLLNDKKFTLDEATYGSYRGQSVVLNYYEKEITAANALCEVSEGESKSFVFNNRLYIITKDSYLVYAPDVNDGKPLVIGDSDLAYIPTTYRSLPVGKISPEDVSKHEYEQKNLLQKKFKHTYVADGETNEYPLYDNGFSAIEKIRVYTGYTDQHEEIYEDLTADTYEVITKDGMIKFNTPPPAHPEEAYANVEVIFIKTEAMQEEHLSRINNCTVFATFDKRVFMAGNPDYPNNLWFCGINNATGFEDATYFGELNVVVDGVENAPITGLIPVADTLAAIKNETHQDGSVYFHNRLETNMSVVPVTYPNTQGLSGIGCVGACVNFLDDPIFISRLGVEGIEKMAINLERSISHRSSLIDAKLVNLDLEKNKPQLAEWDGYLVILVPNEGKIFLADSRQRYTHDSGVMQYEWYYLENIGIYEDQKDEYYYSPVRYEFIPADAVVTHKGIEYPIDIATHVYNNEYMRAESLLHTAVKIDEYAISDEETEENTVFLEKFKVTENIDGNEITTTYEAYFILKRTWDGESYLASGEPELVTKAILCEYLGSKTGGKFYSAMNLVNIDKNIFFGTDNGIVCSFNFDKKDEDGTIPPKFYSFDNRTIYCGIATKMDNCSVPHLTKSTIKKSTVIKTKSMRASAAKVRVRTNNKGYYTIARVNSRIFSFDDLDFSDFSFVSSDQTIFSIKEKEKHWVEKQHWIYSDEYQRPFSVHYLAFRYKISGRIKG